MSQLSMHLPWPFHDSRREIVEQPFPDAWLSILESRIALYSLLNADEQFRLRGDLRIFFSEKNWEGALGMQVTDEVKVTISAAASLLTVGFERHDYFPNVKVIIVYPNAYQAPSQTIFGREVDLNPQGRLGEAHGIGPVILSWPDVLSGCENWGDGHNLVLHEFAHKLDFRDGDANGVPPMRDQEAVDEWARVMSAEYDLLVDEVQRGRHSILSPYGATNPAEFFAVGTECFFEKPSALLKQKPELYKVLADYYGMDWAERLRASSSHV